MIHNMSDDAGAYGPLVTSSERSSPILLCSRPPHRRQNQVSGCPGLGSAQPIACATARRAALDAVAAIRTIEAEEDGAHQRLVSPLTIAATGSGRRGRAGRASQG